MNYKLKTQKLIFAETKEVYIIMQELRNILQKKSYTVLLVCLIILAVIGHILNAICEHRYFYFNQYFLFIMLIIQKFVTKKIDEENTIIEKELLNAKETEVRGSFITKTNFLLNTMKWRIIPIFFVCFYIFAMFEVGCLEITITGFYGGILGTIVFYNGIQTYIRYLMLLYFSYDLKKVQLENYFFYIPALTGWIVFLAREFSYIEKWFLVLGLMYSSIYAINIPSGAISISHGISFHTSSNFLFFITWIGIIIFFAFAVPIFTFLSRYFIKECIRQCKGKSIKKLQKQIDILSVNSTKEELAIIQVKLSLIKEISTSEDYPPEYRHTAFDKGYTICLALVTFISPFTSIIEQLIFKR